MCVLCSRDIIILYFVTQCNICEFLFCYILYDTIVVIIAEKSVLVDHLLIHRYIIYIIYMYTWHYVYMPPNLLHACTNEACMQF